MNWFLLIGCHQSACCHVRHNIAVSRSWQIGHFTYFIRHFFLLKMPARKYKSYNWQKGTTYSGIKVQVANKLHWQYALIHYKSSVQVKKVHTELSVGFVMLYRNAMISCLCYCPDESFLLICWITQEMIVQTSLPVSVRGPKRRKSMWIYHKIIPNNYKKMFKLMLNIAIQTH